MHDEETSMERISPASSYKPADMNGLVSNHSPSKFQKTTLFGDDWKNRSEFEDQQIVRFSALFDCPVKRNIQIECNCIELYNTVLFFRFVYQCKSRFVTSFLLYLMKFFAIYIFLFVETVDMFWMWIFLPAPWFPECYIGTWLFRGTRSFRLQREACLLWEWHFPWIKLWTAKDSEEPFIVLFLVGFNINRH